MADWSKYQAWNRRNERMAQVWIQPLVQYLATRPATVRRGNVLDFGCGYFDAGLALLPKAARVDGVDLDTEALAVARERAAAVGGTSELVNDLGQLAASGRRYDLIFINSVLQYLPDVVAVRKTLTRLRDLLSAAPDAELVIADLLPATYSASRDALRGLGVAVKTGVLVPMVVHLAKAATRPKHLDLLRLGPEEMTGLARELGLACEILPRNLTPSRERFSVRLARAGGT